MLQQEEEETILCQNQITILQIFSQKNLLAIEMKKTTKRTGIYE